MTCIPKPITIAFTVNDSYAQHCCVAMVSALENNKTESLDIYILTDFFSDKNRRLFEATVARYGSQNRVRFIIVDDTALRGLRLNIGYITHHTYYRFLLPELFPAMDRILYLDADLVVDGPLRDLWETPLEGFYAAGVDDSWIKQAGYKFRIGMTRDELYFNAGMLLMNLEMMRRDGIPARLLQLAHDKGSFLDYQDQDILNLTLRGGVQEVPGTYNYMAFDDYQRKEPHPVIIHYNGDVKPWSTTYKCRNTKASRYFAYLQLTPYRSFRLTHLKSLITRTLKKAVGIDIYPTHIRIALVVDEYFGARGTTFGDSGYFARNYLARYIPDPPKIRIDVLLPDDRRSKFAPFARRERVDRCKLITPPGRLFVKQWLRRKNYDLFLTVEHMHEMIRAAGSKPIVHLIQNPRSNNDWKEIQTLKLMPETYSANSRSHELINELYRLGQVTILSHGHFLNDKARELYRLPDQAPITYLPNPIDIDYEFDAATYPKKNHILFIGCTESIKRGGLFCEIAKRMPQYQFFILCRTVHDIAHNDKILANYREIPNLHFVEHVEGEQKAQYIRDAKILVNTSIYEALPITFLEALAYGTLLVSCRNPEELTSQFGRYVGPVLGDGFEQVGLFVDAIEELMSNGTLHRELSVKAVEHIREVHSVHKFKEQIRSLIRNTAKK